MNLSNLIKKGTLRQVATVTVATVATDRSSIPSSVANVASVNVANERTGGNWLGTVATVATVTVAATQAAASNDAAPQPLATILSDPDRWCWPHSDAMNGAEIDAFTARLARFTDKGLTLYDAEALSDKLVKRDRNDDHRRLCLECTHLQGVGRWSCGNWRQAAIGTRAADAGLAHGLVVMLQHCPGFREATWAR